MDQRSPLQKWLWDNIGPPLYYCAECLRPVRVTPVDGSDPIIKRPCTECAGAGIIAPRKAIVAGKGGLSLKNKTKVKAMQLGAALTGRSV